MCGVGAGVWVCVAVAGGRGGVAGRRFAAPSLALSRSADYAATKNRLRSGASKGCAARRARRSAAAAAAAEGAAGDRTTAAAATRAACNASALSSSTGRQGDSGMARGRGVWASGAARGGGGRHARRSRPAEQTDQATQAPHHPAATTAGARRADCPSRRARPDARVSLPLHAATSPPPHPSACTRQQ